MGTRTAAITFGYGCSRARVDVAALFDYVEANGWELADSIEAADIVIVSTCAFDEDTEDKSDQVLVAADRRRRADSGLIVVGCAGHIMAERLSELGARAIPPRRFAEIDDALGASVPLAEIPDPNHIEERVSRAGRYFTDGDRHGDDGPAVRALRAFTRATRIRERLAARGLTTADSYLKPSEKVFTLRVARGCLGSCTYCIIKQSKEAELTSKPLAAVLDEFDAGLAAGYREFKLVAQDLGAYGQDLDTDVAELLQALLSRDGDFRLTIADLGGRWFVRYADRLIATLSEHADKVRFLSIPVQTGSDRLLASMRRGHTATEIEPLLRELRSRAPGVHLSTQAMIGFPGETEADFRETERFLASVDFDRVDIFDFSARAGTPAAEMTETVPDAVIRQRSRRLRRAFGGRAAGIQYAARAWARQTNRRRRAGRAIGSASDA